MERSVQPPGMNQPDPSDLGISRLADIAQAINAIASSVATSIAVTTTRGDLIARGVNQNQRLALGADKTILASDGNDPVWRTLTAEFDAVLGSTRGRIITRGASAWDGIAVGSANQFLQSDGIDPLWRSLSTLLDAVIGSSRGSLIVRGAATWGVITVGAANTVFKSDATDPSWGTVTALLDALFSSTQGAVLYRGAATWAALAPGTANQQLTSGGAAANPAWGGGIVTIASGAANTGTTVTIANIPAIYNHLILKLTGISSDTATRHPRVQVDTDNGASPDATAGNYIGESNAGAPAAFGEASLLNGLADVAAAVTMDAVIYIYGYQGGPNMYFRSFARQSTPTITSNAGYYFGSTTAINALTLLWNGSGNFDGSGAYVLYGVL